MTFASRACGQVGSECQIHSTSCGIETRISGSRTVRRRKKTETINSPRLGGQLLQAIERRPREFVGIVVTLLVTLAVFTNALFLQTRSHSVPVFAPRSLLSNGPDLRPGRLHDLNSGRNVEAGAQARSLLVSDIQRELGRRGFYAGEVDGIWGTKTDLAARDFVHSAKLDVSPEASDRLLRAIIASDAKVERSAARKDDPIAGLIKPSAR